MRLRRFGTVTDDGDPTAVVVLVSPERARDWADLPRGTVLTLESEDTERDLVADLAEFRGNLAPEAVEQLRELRPRLLDFLDRARALEEGR